MTTAPDLREWGSDADADGSLGVLVLPPPSRPMAVARVLAARHVHDGISTLRHWRGGWWMWAASHWVERETAAIRLDCYAFTEHAAYVVDEETRPWAPTRSKIANLMEALAAITYLDEDIDQPSWIEGVGPSVVSVGNGLLDLASRRLLPHSPRYFNQTAVPFDFDPDAPPPTRWLRFWILEESPFEGEGGEPTLDEVHPGSVGRGEVEPAVAEQPPVGCWCLVGRKVVRDEVHVEIFGTSQLILLRNRMIWA